MKAQPLKTHVTRESVKNTTMLLNGNERTLSISCGRYCFLRYM